MSPTIEELRRRAIDDPVKLAVAARIIRNALARKRAAVNEPVPVSNEEAA